MSARLSDLKDLPDWPRLMSAGQAAAYVGVSDETFKRAVEDGLMPPSVKLRSRTLWNRRAIDQYADRLAGLSTGEMGRDDAISDEEWGEWRP